MGCIVIVLSADGDAEGDCVNVREAMHWRLEARGFILLQVSNQIIKDSYVIRSMCDLPDLKFSFLYTQVPSSKITLS